MHFQKDIHPNCPNYFNNHIPFLEYDVDALYDVLEAPPRRPRPLAVDDDDLLIDGRDTLRLLASLPCGDEARDADGVLNCESDPFVRYFGFFIS